MSEPGSEHSQKGIVGVANEERSATETSTFGNSNYHQPENTSGRGNKVTSRNAQRNKQIQKNLKM